MASTHFKGWAYHQIHQNHYVCYRQMPRSVFSNFLSPKFAKSEPLVSPLPSPALQRALRSAQGSTRSGEPEAGAGWCCPTKPPPSPSYIL